MELKVIWTEPAIEDLRQIHDYIAEDNPAAAAEFGTRLFESTRHLGRFPRSNRVYQKSSAGTVRELICHGFRIFYQEHRESIEILHVRHGARQEPDF